MTALSIILEEDELQQLTGYKQPSAQIAELQRRGFYRARRSRVTGSVILERAHYLAVCAGIGTALPTERPRLRPSLRTPKLRR